MFDTNPPSRRAGWRLQPHSIGFTLLLGALGTLPPFAIDMALPALTQIGIALQSAMGTVLLTLSFFMAGFSLAQLVFGPVSDRFGRWPTLVAGCSLFSVASIACALAPTIEFLLVARFIEGCGAGAGMVMVFAMVRDLFEGPQARTKLSYVTVVLNVAPMIAPAVGAALLSIGDWRLIYWALGLGGAALTLTILLGLQESLAAPDPTALRLPRLLGNYGRVLRHRVALAYILINGLSFGCMFAYVAGSSFVLMRLYGLSAAQYSLAFGGAALSILLGSFVSGQLSRAHVPLRVPMTLGLGGAFAASLALAAMTLWTTPGLAVFYGVLVVATFCYGLIAPNAAHGALQPLPEIAGVAGASLGFVQMTAGSVASALVAWLSDGQTALSMTVTMAVCAGLALTIYIFGVVPIQMEKTKK